MADITTIRINCLSTFDDDEQDQIKQILAGDKDDVEIDFNYWQGDEDGTEADIQSLFEQSSDQTMVFMDRDGLDGGYYIIGDGRCFQQEWFQTHVLSYYGWTYTDAWGESSDAAQILGNAAVPYCRITADAKIDIVDVWQNYQNNDEFMLTDYMDQDDVLYSFTGNFDDFVQALTDLDITPRDADGEEKAEENQESAEENDEDDQ